MTVYFKANKPIRFMNLLILYQHRLLLGLSSIPLPFYCAFEFLMLEKMSKKIKR